jgi:hypothetical protein
MTVFKTKRESELAVENPPPDEQCHIDSLIHVLRAKMQRDYNNSRILRDAHPKMHGCVRADFSIVPNLPSQLSIGVFKQARRFPAWVRFSNQSGTIQGDSKRDIRGVAIKLMEVEGARLLPDGPPGTTQDFILISDSRFVTRDVAEFDGLVKAMVAGTIPVAWYFLTHLRVLRNLACSLRRFSNPLAIRYFSVVPSLLGDRAVKYALTPNRGNQCLVPKRRSDDYLREVMVDQLMSQDAVFDFSVQFQVDPKRMPIEDAGVTWDEKLSPFCKVATLTIPSQVFDTPNRREFGDNLSFNPWRCLPEHRPLGGISRGRRQVYQSLSAFRHGVNQAVLQEPTVGMKASDA